MFYLGRELYSTRGPVMRRNKPMTASRLTMNLIGIVAEFTAVIVTIYAWLIPLFFNGYKNFSFIIAGVCVAALLGGGDCHKANNFTGKSATQLVPFLCEVAVAFLVSLFSLLIIVNIRGT